MLPLTSTVNVFWHAHENPGDPSSDLVGSATMGGYTNTAGDGG
jgi:hypothetical protein